MMLTDPVIICAARLADGTGGPPATPAMALPDGPIAGAAWMLARSQQPGQPRSAAIIILFFLIPALTLEPMTDDHRAVSP